MCLFCILLYYVKKKTQQHDNSFNFPMVKIELTPVLITL